MSILPVTLACAGAITVFGVNPFTGGDRFLRGLAGKKPAIPGKKDEMIFERALVLIDLPACASGTVELVARIPGIGEAILLDVTDAAGSSGTTWITGRSVLSPCDRAKMRLAAHKNYLEELGTPARALVELDEDNDSSGTFLSVASRENASLVIMRSEPMSRLRSAFMENNTTRVLRQCTTQDMLIYPVSCVEKAGEMLAIPPEKNMFARVLCPTDLSTFSLETLLWAAHLDAVSEILLLHVIPVHGISGHDAAVSDAEHKLAGIKSSIERRDLKVEIIVSEGDPAREICRIAGEQKASLILMPRCGLGRYVGGGELGNTIAGVANHLTRPLLARVSRLRLHMNTRELATGEFGIAEELWKNYHDQKADRENDRILAVYLEGEPVSVAWCKRHPDGLEVDGVFTLEAFRRHHYARRAVEALIAACGSETLYMHATLELVEFYSTLGFIPIPEDELPPTIKERFAFALGNLEGANACPMRRVASPPRGP